MSELQSIITLLIVLVIGFWFIGLAFACLLRQGRGAEAYIRWSLRQIVRFLRWLIGGIFWVIGQIFVAFGNFIRR